MTTTPVDGAALDAATAQSSSMQSSSMPTSSMPASPMHAGATGHAATHDPEWFKRAVFYEVLVRGFADSNGDGTGDLRGLTDKLDYLQWLGIDCLWLPPFFSSPLRDGGL